MPSSGVDGKLVRVEFRERLLATLRAIRSLFDEQGVLVVGSEVPNLLESGAASTLVVSGDVDIGVPIAKIESVKRRLKRVRGLKPSSAEPSVWVPGSGELIEVNFLGIDRSISDPDESYALQDPELPLLVFGPLSWLEPGPPVMVGNLRIPLPRPAGLIVEKLVTDRSAEKGDRDLLVALGLLSLAAGEDLLELERIYLGLSPENRHALRANLTVLSLLHPRAGMPDPRPHREMVAGLLRRLEEIEP